MTAPRIELERLARRYHRQRGASEQTYSQLVAAIVDARRQGMTLRAIAETTGLSFGRIHQIERSRRD